MGKIACGAVTSNSPVNHPIYRCLPMKSLSFLCLALYCICASAEGKLDHIRFLSPDAVSPKADLTMLTWLAGHWRGQALGGDVEEVWAPPLAGSMMGAFKLVVDGKVKFYELETITEENGTLILRLKHFGPLLKGWEEKEESVDFPLVAFDKTTVFFDGLTLKKPSDSTLKIYIAMRKGGVLTEEVFVYERVD